MDKTIKVLKLVVAVLVVILVGWMIIFDVNVGVILSRIFGTRKTAKIPRIMNADGEEIGKTVQIVENKNPLRDKRMLSLEDGQKIKLPKHIKDTDVEEVLIIDPEVYNVKVNSKRLTSLFD